LGVAAATPYQGGGFVLVAVLVLIMLASMVAISVLFRLRAEDTAAAASAGAEQAWAAAMSGVQEAIRVARAAPPGFTDWRNDPRAFRDRFVCEDGSDRWFFTVYSPPDDDTLAELRFGLTDEASKLNLNSAHSTNLTGFPRLSVQQVAALRDFIDWDDTTRPDGAEQEYYSGLARPYAIRNGPLQTLDELLLIRGFTPALLHGEDANMNWRLDPNENDADERPPADNNDGRLDLGLQPLLTVSSYDPNDDNDGVPRTDFNNPNDPLPGLELPAALTNFIAVLRTNKFKLAHAADLLEGTLKVKGPLEKEVEIASGIRAEELPLALDLFTASAARRFDGLVNINTASLAVLSSVPGIDTPLAESILSTRRSISPERRATIAWLVQEGVVDAARFKQLAPFLTARSLQFSFRVVGFGLPSGRFRVLDVVIDLAQGEPVVTYLRDLTRLGLPFRLEPELQAQSAKLKVQNKFQASNSKRVSTRASQFIAGAGGCPHCLAERGHDGSRELQPTVGNPEGRASRQRRLTCAPPPISSVADATPSWTIPSRGLKSTATVKSSLRDGKKVRCDRVNAPDFWNTELGTGSFF
jgi:hypothetical protein